MGQSDALCKTFQTKAEAVSALVSRVDSLGQALAYTVDLCARKEACQLLVAGCGEPLSAKADSLCRTKQQKIIAAPGLAPGDREQLNALCRDSGILLTDRPLREHLAGIDIGFTLADYGIAETGTLVIDSRSETVRLATMISEIHVAVLPVTRIRARSDELLEELGGLMGKAPGYLAFVTGASRTADIERVLAIGVHGPLELHILLLEDS
jgi:L-lactate dehydrogenase complex protein LldG